MERDFGEHTLHNVRHSIPLSSMKLSVSNLGGRAVTEDVSLSYNGERSRK